MQSPFLQPLPREPLSHNPRLSNLNGSTLIISMLFLTLMSFMGLAAMQSAGLGEKMAANYRYGVTAFHAAEAGIELAIKNHTNNSISTSISGELGQSSYNATIIDSAGVYTVTSNGAHSNSGAKREIVATLSGAVGSKPTIVNWISSE